MPPGPWWGRGLVPIEPVQEPVPALLESARVPLAQRECSNCRSPVGRSGVDRGNCPVCQTWFDFVPRLHPGDTVDNGRYKVRGVLSHGGFGWAYLADDTQLGHRVVLKGVISDQVAATVARERAHLTNLEHPYIVRIWGYVSDGHYLVLSYAGGRTARPVKPPEPLAPLLALGLQLLEALDYLHGKGFLHCDVKPANIILGGDRLRLIDFGAVRTLRDRTPISTCTPRYSPAPGDPEYQRPTPGFDLYCAGRTLEELCDGYLDPRLGLPGLESLRLLLERATHREPERRFTSARQFAEQLSGVIHQVVGGPDVAHRSVVFAPMMQALDGGLGDVLPLGDWARARPAGAGGIRLATPPFGHPAPGQAAEALPALLPDPWDVPRGSTPAGDGAAAAETQFRACHAALRHGDPASAERLLAETALPAADWRAAWYRGLIRLAQGRAGLAAEEFGQVRAALPGELVPLLALGLCAELQGDPAVAAGRYEMVSATDASLIAAHFGLARALLAAGERAAAVTALDRVPPESRFEPTARIAAVRSLSAVVVTAERAAVPAADDVRRARELRQDLHLDELSGTLLDAEFAYAEATGSNAAAGPSGAARAGLERALRRVAAFAPSERAHTALIDLANAVRPVTILSW